MVIAGPAGTWRERPRLPRTDSSVRIPNSRDLARRQSKTRRDDKGHGKA